MLHLNIEISFIEISMLFGALSLDISIIKVSAHTDGDPPPLHTYEL